MPTRDIKYFLIFLETCWGQRLWQRSSVKVSSLALPCTPALSVFSLDCFRNVLGTKNLSEILSERESIGETMHANLVGKIRQIFSKNPQFVCPKCCLFPPLSIDGATCLQFGKYSFTKLQGRNNVKLF